MSEGRAFIVRLLEGITAFFLLAYVVLRSMTSGDFLILSDRMGDTLFVSLPVWVALVFWLLRVAFSQRMKVYLAGGDLFLLLLLLLVLLSSRPPADLALSLHSSMTWASSILFVYLAVNVGREARFAQWVLAALLASAATIAFIAFLQWGVDLPSLKAHMESDPSYLASTTTPEMLEELRNRAQTGRPWGTFGNENSLAGYLALCFFPLLGLLLGTDRQSWRLSTRALLLLLLLGLLVVCRSKGGTIGFCVGLAAFLWVGRVCPFASAVVRRVAVAAGVLAAIALVGLSWTSLDPLKINQKYSSAWYRVGYWKGAVRVLEEHPWRGVGLENFQEHYDEVKDAEAGEVRRVHNDYLQVAVELGVFGLLAFLGFWVTTLVRCIRVPAETTDSPPPGEVWLRNLHLVVASLAAGGIGIYLANSVTGSSLDCLAESEVFALGCAWLLAFLILKPAPRQPGTPWLRAGLVAGLAAALAHAGIDMHFYVHNLAFTIWAIAAILIFLSQEARREPPVVDLELGFGWSLGIVAVAGGFAAVIGGAIVPVMDHAREEEAILREADQKTGHPNWVEAARLAPWDPLPLLRQAEFRHAACLQMTKERLSQEFGTGAMPLTPDVARHLSDVWLACVPCLQEAVKIAPRDRTAWDWLGRFHKEHAQWALDLAATEGGPAKETLQSLATSELEEALRAFQESYRLYPTRPENAWQVGETLECLGRQAEAMPYLEKALALNRMQVLDRLRLPPDVAAGLEKRFGER